MPLLNPFTSEEIAYGNRQIPKLISGLSPTSVSLETSLLSLTRLLHFPENAFTALSSRILTHTDLLLQSRDIPTVLSTTECLKVLASHSLGRTALAGSIKTRHFNTPVKSSSEAVRMNVYSILLMCCGAGFAVEEVIEAGLWTVLVKKARIETEVNQVVVLSTMYCLLRHSKDKTLPALAMQTRTLPILTNLIATTNRDCIKIEALNCITALCEIKIIATQQGIIGVLVKLLVSTNDLVLAAACGALMSVTVEVDAKKVFVKEEGVDAIAKLLESGNQTVLMNAIQTITNCAEDYRARFQFQRYLARLKELEGLSPELAVISTRAAAIITWRP